VNSHSSQGRGGNGHCYEVQWHAHGGEVRGAIMRAEESRVDAVVKCSNVQMAGVQEE
jgi:hypothetical protein